MVSRLRFQQFFNILRRFKSDKLSDFERQYENPKCLKIENIPLAIYGGRHTATMIPGTGIGPELMVHVRTLFKEMGVPVDFEIVEMRAVDPKDEDLKYALHSLKRNGVGLIGNVEAKSVVLGDKRRHLTIRNELDLYAYVVPCESYPGVPAKHKDVNIIIIRQNTEGEYSTLEHGIGGPGNRVVESLKIIRRDGAIRLATFAFEYARRHKRKKITTIHKANIMKLSDGLFLEVNREVSKKYPDIQHQDMIIDNCCMQLVSNPKQFDVILATNLYGSILANVICGLTGGPGLISGRNHGDYYAIFEPGTRHEARTKAGKNVANPVAMMNAAANMLYHLGHSSYAERIENAVFKTISEDKIHTPDLGGKAKTSDVIEKIYSHL